MIWRTGSAGNDHRSDALEVDELFHLLAAATLASPRRLHVSSLSVVLGKTPTERLGSTQAAKLAGKCASGNADAYLAAHAATGE
jgi:hypothetical protein